MTLADIKDVILAVDPDATHYFRRGGGENYTTWKETEILPDAAGNRHVEGWMFVVNRFTKSETDEIDQALFQAFEADDRIAFTKTTLHEEDTGYIHHVYDCEGI